MFAGGVQSRWLTWPTPRPAAMRRQARAYAGQLTHDSRPKSALSCAYVTRRRFARLLDVPQHARLVARGLRCPALFDVPLHVRVVARELDGVALLDILSANGVVVLVAVHRNDVRSPAYRGFAGIRDGQLDGVQLRDVGRQPRQPHPRRPSTEIRLRKRRGNVAGRGRGDTLDAHLLSAQQAPRPKPSGRGVLLPESARCPLPGVGVYDSIYRLHIRVTHQSQPTPLHSIRHGSRHRRRSRFPGRTRRPRTTAPTGAGTRTGPGEYS